MKTHTITDHQTPGDEANARITITADERDPANAGASHIYEVDETRPTGHSLLRFQRGPLHAPESEHGITIEALIAVAIDRLRGFQTGEHHCRENALALTHFEQGLHWLRARTLARIAAGIEGTNSREPHPLEPCSMKYCNHPYSAHTRHAAAGYPAACRLCTCSGYLPRAVGQRST